MKNILITGGCGFIGSHLSEYLLKKGFNVKIFDRYNSNNHWGWIEYSKYKKHFDVNLGDIRDIDSVKKAIKGCDAVIHLAALIGIPYSYISPMAYVKTNIEGTYNVLESSKELNIEKLIVTSTSEVYGSAIFLPIDESHPLQPQSPYSASKIGADNLTMSYFNSFDLPITIIRPFNTFGPRQSARAIIPTIFSQIYNNKFIKLGNTHTTRDFTYVTDLCRAYEKILKIKNKKIFGEIYNVGNNNEISINELILKIQKITGIKKPIKIEKKRLRTKNSEVNRLRCDASKFHKLTKWKPIYRFEDELKTFDKWFLKNNQSYKTNIYNV